MNDDDILQHLILNGAAEFAAMDPETGEMLYSFTPKLKEVMPELYREHMKNINQDVMLLWEMGFLNVNFMEDNPIVELTEKAFDEAEIAKLSNDNAWSLKEIIRAIKQSEI